MVWPLLPFVIGGAALGAGIGAAAGPDEEPLWKRMLVGGALGGTAGLGLGSFAGAGAAAGGVGAGGVGAGGASAGAGGAAAANAAPTAITAPTLTGGTAAAPLANPGLGASLSGGGQFISAAPVHGSVVPGATAANSGLGSMVPAGLQTPTISIDPTAPSTFANRAAFQASNFGNKTLTGLEKAGALMADNPLPTAMGLAGAGYMMLPDQYDGGNSYAGGKSSYQGVPSWERERQMRVNPTNFSGRLGVGQRYFS